MNPCSIVQDLLPLYADNTCSPGTREYVEEHIADCPACKALLESMKELIEFNPPKQDSKKNFRRFSSFLVRRRVLTITLCILLALTGSIAILWRPVINPYLNHPFYPPLDDMDAQLSMLSDGSVYVRFTYIGDQNIVAGGGVGGGSDGEYTANFQYSRMSNFLHRILPPEASEFSHAWILHTAESKYFAVHQIAPAISLTLIGSDGERILWQEGDELPPADEEAEALLQSRIDRGHCIPTEEYYRRVESGEIEFG